MHSNDITSRRPGDGGRHGERDRAEGDAAQQGDATVEEQAALVHGFLEGLLDAFALDGDVIEERLDEDTIEVRVQGDDLGLLIGPKGQTLQAVHDLSRTFVQRRATGTHHGRVRIDIGAYRQRRREALARFSREVAESVVASGASKALEPMNPADRKVVHDTVNGINGVITASEGVEPRRWVVILPALAAVDAPTAAEHGDLANGDLANTEGPAADRS